MTHDPTTSCYLAIFSPLGCPTGIEPVRRSSQPRTLPLSYGHHRRRATATITIVVAGFDRMKATASQRSRRTRLFKDGRGSFGSGGLVICWNRGGDSNPIVQPSEGQRRSIGRGAISSGLDSHFPASPWHSSPRPELSSLRCQRLTSLHLRLFEKSQLPCVPKRRPHQPPLLPCQHLEMPSQSRFEHQLELGWRCWLYTSCSQK